MPKVTQKNFFKISLVGIVFGFLVLWNPAGFTNPLRAATAFLLTPFQKVFYFISVRSTETKDFLFAVGQLKKENEELVQKNQRLLAENARLNDVEKENIFLREQLNVLPRDKYELLAASVVSYDPNGSWFEIDKGSANGLTEGMPVVVSGGILLGKLQEVYESSSRVILLTNPKSAINGMISETGAKGITKGQYGLGILLDMVAQTDQLKTGDELITSGIGGNIPRGLYIGMVQEVRPSDDQLFKQAVIIPPVQANKLQFVFVIKENKK